MPKVDDARDTDIAPPVIKQASKMLDAFDIDSLEITYLLYMSYALDHLKKLQPTDEYAAKNKESESEDSEETTKDEEE